MHLSVLFMLVGSANCFTFSRFDYYLENEGLVRVRRDTKTLDTSSSSEEEHLSADATTTPTALKKMIPGSGEKDDSHETDQKVVPKISAVNTIEGSGTEVVERPSRDVEGSGLESSGMTRVLLDDASDLSVEDGSGRLIRDTEESSGFDMARFADLPLGSSENGEFELLREIRSEGSGSEDARIAREVEEGSGAESDIVRVKSSEDASRISRDVEGSGETVVSAPVRFIREGSGALAE